MPNKTVKQGYNTVFRQYLAERMSLGSSKYVRKLLKILPKEATILDLGCGAGMPVDDLLIAAGHTVVGIDISEEMIAQACKNCPGASYTVGDISQLKTGEYQATAVVCFYALFHVPRERQGKILKTIASFLPIGGVLLITMGERDFEGVTQFYNQPMWWSQWGPKKNRELIEQAGFEIWLDEIDHTGAENHQIIMARKAN